MDSPAGLVGQTIGKYRIVEHLGRGGMAEVYKAYQPSLDRYVALKLMHAFLASDQDFIARFEREAKNVAALRHPNIIQVFDFDVHNGTPYMVMEFIEGGTLKSYLEDLARSGKSLDLSDALRYIREVGHALAYAHRRNMIHRDIKPANVLLDTGGRVILTDFGIAKILTGPSFTMTGATVGTPAYMSPEQSLGRPGDHRSDLYALGVMLYQLATGQLPYEADTPLAVMLKHVNEPLPLPRTFAPDLPEGIERIILKSMAKNPDDRFQSADEMLAQLDDLETATHLAIPPASMAAGAAAHAATVSPGAAAAARPMATMLAGPTTGQAAVGATQLSRSQALPGTVVKPPVGPLAPSAVKGPSLMLFALVGVVLLFVLVGGSAFALTRGFGLFKGPAPTHTGLAATATTSLASPSAVRASATAAVPSATVPAGSSTPDLVASQVAALQETQAALALALATATSTSTPDLTATAQACTYGYEISSQDPADGKSLSTGAMVKKTVTIKNTGACAFPAGMAFTETVPAPNLAGVQLDVPPIGPGQTTIIVFNWPGPTKAGTMQRGFEMRLPDGTLVGQTVTFTFKYVVAATPRPAATNTPVPPPATATRPVAQGLTDIYPAAYVGCTYQGQNNMDYNCTVKLGWGGAGTGRMTLSLDGQQVGAFNSAAGEAMYFNIISRRCLPKPYNIHLVDDATVTQISKDFYFDPASNGGLFPGGACTVAP